MPATPTIPAMPLAKRLLRHQDELFQFVLVPGLVADNNLAERSIRPLVIMRKISGGTRSPRRQQNASDLGQLARHLGSSKPQPLPGVPRCPAAKPCNCPNLNPLTPTLNSYAKRGICGAFWVGV